MNIAEIKYDLDILLNQKSILINAIDNGNWEGYSESLLVRKSNLKALTLKIDKLKKYLSKEDDHKRN